MESANHLSMRWRSGSRVLVLLVFFLAIAGIFFRAQAADFVWWSTRNAPLTFAIDSSATRHFEIADHYFDAHQGAYDLERARRYYEDSLKLDPQILAAWHQLARIDFLEGNFPKALFEINEQIRLHGDAVNGSYYVRGLIHGYQKEFSAAEADFKTYLALHPKSWGVYNDLAWVYFQEGEYQKAALIAKQGLALRPQNAWLLTSYGVALAGMGAKNEARSVLTEALQEVKKLSPEAWSHNNPGNDPQIAALGLAQMTTIIQKNLDTLAK